MSLVRPAASAPLGLVAPFFVVAPAGAMLGGWMLARSEDEAFLAVNVPSLVAATHAVVLGWLTLSIMGAVYQLGPAVFGGRLVSVKLGRVQFLIHITSVAWFTFAVRDWDVTAMGVGASGLLLSVTLFLVNAVPAVGRPSGRSLPQIYAVTALGFFALTVAVGVAYVGDLEHYWFAMTQGRVAGHAHLGLMGWLALMVMGLSYQLVPMFEVVKRGVGRFGKAVLVVTTTATLVGALTLMADPGPAVRAAIAVGFAIGPLMWLIDMIQMLRARSRRKLDIHSRATAVSLVFLALAMGVGVAAAIGEPVAPGGQPARLQLAYGVLAIGGWAGTTLIANSLKIVPFLVWNARFRPLAGIEPVPLLADLAKPALTNSVLIVHMTAMAVLAGGALLGNLEVLRIGGVLFAAAGLTHFSVLVSIMARRPAHRARVVTSTRGVTG